MRKQIDELLAKKMDRKEFLKHLGVGTLALFGFGAALKLLGITNGGVQPTTSSAGKGESLAYGASVYGGKRQS